MVRTSRKESIFDGLSNREAVDDNIPVDNEDNFKGEGREQSGSEVTVMEIDNLRNGCVKEMEDNLKRRLLQNQRCYFLLLRIVYEHYSS